MLNFALVNNKFYYKSNNVLYSFLNENILDCKQILILVCTSATLHRPLPLIPRALLSSSFKKEYNLIVTSFKLYIIFYHHSILFYYNINLFPKCFKCRLIN